LRFTDEELRRYSRQMIVPELGGIGQERLRAATATASCEIEALYLAAAGIGMVRVPSPAVAEAVRALNPLVAVKVDSSGENMPFDAPVEHSALSAWRTLKGALDL
jgi:molybdopterin/thiamine biosynthesis adenylyltransferase